MAGIEAPIKVRLSSLFERNVVIKALAENSLFPMSTIGRIFDLSKQRVEQIAHRKDRPPIEKMCLTCGKNFLAKTNQKYCSLECHRVAWYKKLGSREARCERCGQIFRTGRKHKIFCSKRCRYLFYAERF